MYLKKSKLWLQRNGNLDGKIQKYLLIELECMKVKRILEEVDDKCGLC